MKGKPMPTANLRQMQKDYRDALLQMGTMKTNHPEYDATIRKAIRLRRDIEAASK
jgi:hypothetical protein